MRDRRSEFLSCQQRDDNSEPRHDSSARGGRIDNRNGDDWGAGCCLGRNGMFRDSVRRTGYAQLYSPTLHYTANVPDRLRDSAVEHGGLVAAG